MVVVITLMIATGCNSQNYEPGKYQKVFPGDQLVDASKLTEHGVKYKRRGGTMEYRLSEIAMDSRNLLRLTIRMQNGKKIFPDTLFFNPGDLSYAGRRLVNYSQGYEMKVDIENGQMAASLTALPDSDWDWVGDFDKQFEHGLFEIAVMNYFIKALTLENGLKVSLPFFIFSEEFPIGWVDVVVEGKEELNIDGKVYQTWKVHSLGGKSGDKTFWISDDYPYALKIHSKGLRPWIFDSEI